MEIPYPPGLYNVEISRLELSSDVKLPKHLIQPVDLNFKAKIMSVKVINGLYEGRVEFRNVINGRSIWVGSGYYLHDKREDTWELDLPGLKTTDGKILNYKEIGSYSDSRRTGIWRFEFRNIDEIVEYGNITYNNGIRSGPFSLTKNEFRISGNFINDIISGLWIHEPNPRQNLYDTEFIYDNGNVVSEVSVYKFPTDTSTGVVVAVFELKDSIQFTDEVNSLPLLQLYYSIDLSRDCAYLTSVLRRIYKNEKLIFEGDYDNEIIRDYITLPEAKEKLKRLSKELSDVYRRERRAESMVFVLLKDGMYFGHIYAIIGELVLIESIGIRTSLRNLLTGEVRGVGTIMADALVEFAKKMFLSEGVRVLTPIGIMPTILEKYGFQHSTSPYFDLRSDTRLITPPEYKLRVAPCVVRRYEEIQDEP